MFTPHKPSAKSGDFSFPRYKTPKHNPVIPPDTPHVIASSLCNIILTTPSDPN